MKNDSFQFDLYRLNILDNPNLMNFMGEPIRSDNDIVKVLKLACDQSYDLTVNTETATYIWSLRGFQQVSIESPVKGEVCSLLLARGISKKDGTIVTPSGVTSGTSETYPPQAIAINLIFYMTRHLVACEYNASLMSSNAWVTNLQQILYKSSVEAGYRSSFFLSPIPQEEEIMTAFRSFTKLTRLKVHLLIPNPDLTPYTKKLFDEMSDGGIREYIQDMKNLNGLNKEEGKLPHASAAMAQDGYRRGEVVLEGEQKGKRKRVITGRKAARGEIETLRDYTRGSLASAKTKEAKAILESILIECNRLTDHLKDDSVEKA